VNGLDMKFSDPRATVACSGPANPARSARITGKQPAPDRLMLIEVHGMRLERASAVLEQLQDYAVEIGEGN
jgi:hypothetical protein